MHSHHFQSLYTPKTTDSRQRSTTGRPDFLRSDPERTDCSDYTCRKAGKGSRRCHHADFRHDDSAAKRWASVRNSNNDSDSRTHPILRETPQLMRKKQEEFLRAVRLSCEKAASDVGIKPASPRLHPCDSPKGAVSPLSLGESGDYFNKDVRLMTMASTTDSSVESTKNLSNI